MSCIIEYKNKQDLINICNEEERRKIIEIYKRRIKILKIKRLKIYFHLIKEEMLSHNENVLYLNVILKVTNNDIKNTQIKLKKRSKK